MKANIQKHYSGSNSGECTSEKFIQGSLILKGRDKYLDSEFAHRLYVGQNKTVRIDLVKVENGFIVFEELKRIGDYRLRNMMGNPEILEQIEGAGEIKVMITLERTEENVLSDRETSVKTTITPTVRGVIVYCSGSRDVLVRQKVLEAASKCLGVGSNRICVTY